MKKKQFVLFCFYQILVSVNGQYLEDPCVRSYDNIHGVCELIHKCDEAKQSYLRGIRPQICSFDRGTPIVCCNRTPLTRTTTTTQAPTRKPTENHRQNYHNPQTLTSNSYYYNRISAIKCEEYKRSVTRPLNVGSLTLLPNAYEARVSNCSLGSSSLIVGGETTKPGEFPHMAILGQRSNGYTNWICGGSLISENFVLTAAHCIRLRNKPNVVRLGDQNLVSDYDFAEPQEFGIKRFVKHPEYNSKFIYHDVALVELNRHVRFSNFVRPACLWFNQPTKKREVIATGWGMLEYADAISDELQKVSLSVINNKYCNQFFERIKQFDRSLSNGVINSQLCAGAVEGGRLVGGKDTCQGDSGGPIQITDPDNPCVYYIVGITSFSVGCGFPNAPGVYTRTSSYLDFIEKIVWGSQS